MFRSEAKRSDVPYGHASMLLNGEGREATEPYKKHANIWRKPKKIAGQIKIRAVLKIRVIVTPSNELKCYASLRNTIAIISSNLVLKLPEVVPNWKHDAPFFEEKIIRKSHIVPKNELPYSQNYFLWLKSVRKSKGGRKKVGRTKSCLETEKAKKRCFPQSLENLISSTRSKINKVVTLRLDKPFTFTQNIIKPKVWKNSSFVDNIYFFTSVSRIVTKNDHLCSRNALTLVKLRERAF